MKDKRFLKCIIVAAASVILVFAVTACGNEKKEE